MSTSYSTLLKLALPTQGELSGTWGTVINENITNMVEEAIAGFKTVNTWSGNAATLSTANGTTAEARAAILNLTDSSTSLSGAANLVCPTLTKTYLIKNGTAQTVTLKTSSGSGIAVPTGKSMWLYCDGTNVVEGVNHIAGALTVAGAITGSSTLQGTTITATTAVVPDASGGADLGTTSLEWGDIFIADDKKIKFGNGQDVSMEYDEDGTDTLLITGDVTIADGTNDFDIASHDGSNGLKLGGTLVASTAAELNIMDGGTGASAITLADADRIVVNDDGTMKQVALTAFETYFESVLDTLSVTSVGALDSGSITSGFGTIDTGASAITTTGAITGGSLTADDVAVNGKVITMTGSASDTAVFTAGTDGTLTIVTTDAAAAAANITITADGTFEVDGTTITLDSSGDIDLNAAGGDVFFKSGGTTFGSATNTSGNLIIKSGTTTALTFSGADVTIAGDLTISGDDLTMGTNTSGAALIADGTNFNPVVISGDISINTSGVAAIGSGVIVVGDMAANSIDSAQYVDGSIDNAHIADDAIDSEHYADGSIDTAHLAADVITGAKIADDAIDSEHYTDGSIDTAHIAADAITSAKIADDAIDSEHYAAGSIDTAHIADNQITLAKMASGTDGNIISYDASGNPVAIATGSDGQVLTSTGAGSPPAFETLETADAERAMAGVLQTNANFIDQVIFGPSVDGVAWNGAWSKASVFSSLMLATVESAGGSSELNIWDLTEQSSGVISTTPLYTVAIGWTSTSIDASMGYVVIGGDVGVKFYDPHDGAWAQRTVGWPRYLSESTTPVLTDNDVQAVAAGLSSTSPLDPRTGGPLPVFACAYGTGADTVSLIKYDGNVWDWDDDGGSIGPTVCGFVDDRMVTPRENSGNQVALSSVTIDQIVADDWGTTAFAYEGNAQQYFLGASAGAAFHNSDSVFADTTGLTIRRNDFIGSTSAAQGVSAMITRAFNSGFLINYTKGAWLANSKTVDRSGSSNTLTQVGTVVEGVASTSTELKGYSDFSTDNYLGRADDADWNSVGTGSAYASIWFKSSGNSADEDLIEFGVADLSYRFTIRLESDGTMLFQDDGPTANVQATPAGAFDDGAWHKADWVRVSSTERYAYLDGVLVGSSTTDAGSLTAATVLRIGIAADSSSRPATSSTLSLARYSSTVPTATQIRQMYDAEKGMFVASAECLLQSGSTDAVLDVDIDPLSGKVIVTQTDAITIFDGLVVDSKPTVNSGASEKGNLWGDLRTEQNAANAYVTAPATDQRQVNEMVRGLASDLPAGVDLSKAKAWAYIIGSGTPAFAASYNIKSLTDNGTGAYRVDFAIPFKSINYISVGNSVIGSDFNNLSFIHALASRDTFHADYYITRADTGAYIDDVGHCVLFFGELENE